MTALIRLRDALGREHMEEFPVDALLPRTNAQTLSRITEDDMEQARRCR